MNAIQTACATSDDSGTWDSIDWNRCECEVKKLQARIDIGDRGDYELLGFVYP